MPSISIVGMQWGDEGKAKIVDYLAAGADAVVRTSGGNNSGHSVVVEGQRYRFATVPCGILHDNVLAIVGNGTAVNPPELVAEINALKDRGLPVENIRISTRAHVVMPYHVILDALMDEMHEGDQGDPSSSRRGIRPCNMDKYARVGIRVCDMLDPKVFERKVRENVREKNRMITKVYGGVQQVNADAVIREYLQCAKALMPYIDETGALLADMLDENKTVIFEGAQATMLDPDYGTYPYVTSSHPTVGGVLCGAGIGVNRLNHTLGVCKAYTTRAGRGPFPTELFGREADEMREHTHEYELTGKYRRIGWFDGVAAHFAARINGFEAIALTRLNSLSYLDEVKICVGYKRGKEQVKYFPASADVLAACDPIYETMPGWGSLKGCKSYDELPAEVKNFIQRIEEIVGIPVEIVEVSSDRKCILSRGNVEHWFEEKDV